MPKKKPTPLQAAFMLTRQEKVYVLVVCAITLLGLVARYCYQRADKPETRAPTGIEKRSIDHG